MRSHELTLGRSVGVCFDHGDDFFGALAELCRSNNVRQGYVPGFIAPQMLRLRDRDLYDVPLLQFGS